MPCIVSGAPRRRILAAAGSLSLVAAAFASGVVAPAPAASATVNGEICLAYWNYCIAYDPNILNQVYDTEESRPRNADASATARGTYCPKETGMRTA
jgi:hypothetical protein